MTTEISLRSLTLSGPVPAKARLFAMPVLMHPQLQNSPFPTTPVLPEFSSIFQLLNESLGGEDGQQSYMILDRIVSPSFVGSVLWEGEEAMTRAFVNGHVLEQEDPFFTTEDLIIDEAICGCKSVIGFIAGAVYRQDEDPSDLTLPKSSQWDWSQARMSVENILSGGMRSMLKHRVLSPMSFEDAISKGLESLCNLHLHFDGGTSNVDADLLNDGSVALSISNSLSSTQFIIGPQTLSMNQVERLLVQINSYHQKSRIESLSNGASQFILH